MGFTLGGDACSAAPSNGSAIVPVSSDDRDVDRKELIKGKLKTLFLKIGREAGLARVLPNQKQEGGGMNGGNPEQNQAWLLAESGGCGSDLVNADPHSVHSSFRFGFCSQLDLESTDMAPASSSASPCFSSPKTVLLVNLDGGRCESRAKEMKCRRIQTLERSISPITSALVRFSYGEIASATGNFSKDRVLGRGALSCVFKGRFGLWGKALAIKRLDKADKESAKAFSRELMIASSLHHPNIVPLVGFCIDPEEGLFLVYRFVSGGSLERHLHEKGCEKWGSSVLPWCARYKVSIGIAEAMAYLHNRTGRCFVHRDIKPSNILLSSKKTPKLCDFGLATWTSAPLATFLCKTVKGTFGYLAPEYFQHGKVSDKTDVYAFGVVLLELLTGRKPVESQGTFKENLVDWAKPLMQQGETAMSKLLDPRLKRSLKPKDSTRIARMILAAALCINSEELQRPSICRIIAILAGKEEAMSAKKDPRVPQLLHKRSDMRSHIALAMLGVSEFEDDDDEDDDEFQTCR